jgi:hypothetical protein
MVKENEIREEPIQFVVTPSEKTEIVNIAEGDNRTVSSWCRIIILEKLNELREHK